MRALRLDLARRHLRVADHAEPGEPGPGQVRLRIVEGGVCGTDRSVAEGEFGAPPHGESELILGHEAVGVVEAVGPQVESLSPGQLVVPMVRRTCSSRCTMCASGRRDNCLTGDYLERGIFGLHGYLCEFANDAVEDLVPVPAALAGHAVLVEPASVIEKAWELALRLHPGEPRHVLVLGAGPIGLLASWCALHSGFGVTVLSREAEDSPRARLLASQGVRYTNTLDGVSADLIFEACGSASLAIASMRALRRLGVLIVLGARPEEVRLPTLDMIIGNHIIAGSVNASRAHFQSAVNRLRNYDRAWLDPLLHRVSLAVAAETLFAPPPTAIKVVHRIGD
ncbi:MAG TPA: alcohol dehydrogenase catalytic domain-containing protein [Bryobacteraceae bacterium]|nr:alcohol dehydrogenase catalytic domain-containing protein [Bryobacteraceae bacterium]